MVSNKNKYEIGYFIAGPEKDADMKASDVLLQTIHNEFKDVFTGIGCFKATYLLQAEEGTSLIRHL